MRPSTRESLLCTRHHVLESPTLWSSYSIIVRTLTPEATAIQRHFMKPLLHEASSSGNLNIAKLLLNNGAGVNALDDRGGSPLYKASQSWQFDVALLLLKSGADVNTRNKYNKTPLHEASAIGNINISRLLLNAGADINARDNQCKVSLGEQRTASPERANANLIDYLFRYLDL